MTKIIVFNIFYYYFRYRANDADDTRGDVKDSRLCIIGVIMVIYGIFVLLLIIPKAYVIKNYSRNNGTTLSEGNLGKDDNKHRKLQFKKSSPQEMFTIKLEEGIKKAKPRLRREIPKQKNKTFWPQNINNAVETKYGKKKFIETFKKQ